MVDPKDERTRFEEWATVVMACAPAHFAKFGPSPFAYRLPNVQCWWDGWQARAAQDSREEVPATMTPADGGAAPMKRLMRLPHNNAYPNYRETHEEDDWCAKAGCVPVKCAESAPLEDIPATQAKCEGYATEFENAIPANREVQQNLADHKSLHWINSIADNRSLLGGIADCPLCSKPAVASAQTFDAEKFVLDFWKTDCNHSILQFDMLTEMVGRAFLAGQRSVAAQLREFAKNHAPITPSELFKKLDELEGKP